MLTAVDHVQLAAPPGSEHQLRAYYAGVLGMTEIPKPPPLAARGGCWFQVDGVQLHLGIDPDFHPATKAHPGLRVHDISVYAARLTARGAEITWDDNLPGHRRFYATDPVGNRLEFLEPDALSGGLDEILWQAWKSLDLPEGYQAEIIDGAIEVSSTGHRRHAVLTNRLRRSLDAHMAGGAHLPCQGVNVIHRRKAWTPDILIAPADLDEIPDEEGLGVDVAGVAVIIEVVSPGRTNEQRDRIRKRREYARAGIPLYVLVDDHDHDHDHDGAVVLLTSPNPQKAIYTDEHRVPYGTDAVLPEGPAKGFVIDEDITRG